MGNTTLNAQRRQRVRTESLDLAIISVKNSEKVIFHEVGRLVKENKSTYID